MKNISGASLIPLVETKRDRSTEPITITLFSKEVELHQGMYVRTADEIAYIVEAFEITPDGNDPYVIGRKLFPQGEFVTYFNEIENEEIFFPASSIIMAVPERILLSTQSE